jgi:hypothetical protein
MFSCGTTQTDNSGQYILTGVGPYQWPVEFASIDDTKHAWQWSGGAANRKQALRVQVTVGGKTSLNAKLTAGTKVSGTVLGTNGALLRTTLFFRDADTGDPVAVFDVTGAYSVSLLPQGVRVSFVDRRIPSQPIVYPGPVVVGTDAMTLNLTGL